MKYYLVLIAFFILTFTATAREWRGLELLQSTKKDVVELFGKPSWMTIDQQGFHYDGKEEKIYFDFASGKCTDSDSAEWKVSKDTLVRIIIQPQLKRFLSAESFDLKTFSRSEPSRQFRVEYVSKDGSTIIKVYSDEKNPEEVEMIIYIPSRDKSDFMCKKMTSIGRDR